MTVQTMRSRLTDADVNAFIKGGSNEERAAAAMKIARSVDRELTPSERAYAEEIVRLMARDAAALVRRALSVALQNSPRLPHDVAKRLAADIDAIAGPVLKNSPVLTDADLISIIESAPPTKQVMVAERPSLSRDVTAVIAEKAQPDAVVTALRNKGAAFGPGELGIALDRFEFNDTASASVAAAMVDRDRLPVSIAERLVAKVTGEVFDKLVNTHELPPQLAIDIATSTRERATVDLVDQAGRQSDTERFVQQLNLAGRLTPSLIARAACLGRMRFVEHALAELSGIPHRKTWLMVHDAGPLGLRAIIERAGLPTRFYAVLRAAVDVFHETELDGGTDDRRRFAKRMVERVLTQFQGVPAEDLDYLLEKLDSLAQHPARAA
jgi:uncharacterized protein (DUF2336 family)